MGKYQVEDEPDRTIPEDTIVRARLEEVKEETIPFTYKRGEKKGQKGEFTKLTWWWLVTDKEAGEGLYEGRKIKGECDAKLTNHPGNKFRNWSEAILGRELEVGQGVDPEEDLQGLVADISIKHRKYESGGEERIAEEVDEVISAGGGDDVPF